MLLTSQPAFSQSSHIFGISDQEWKDLSGVELRQRYNVAERKAEIEEAASHGNVDAMAIAGGAWTDTIWGARDYKKAFAYATAAAKANSVRGMTLMAIMLQDGQGTAKDPAASHYWATLAANQGSAVGYHLMGGHAEYGFGTLKDSAAAFEFYRRSRDRGYAPAYFSIASAYANGLGVPKNLQEAFVQMAQAANLQNPDGMHWYGTWLDSENLSQSPITSSQQTGLAKPQRLAKLKRCIFMA